MSVEHLADIKGAVAAGNDVVAAVPGLACAAAEGFKKTDVSGFRRKFRSLELAVINGTEHKLRFCEEYFNSGTWYDSPNPINIQPGEVSIALVADRQGSVLCGVTGSVKYEIVGASGSKFLYIGFTNPVLGCYKTFIDVDVGKEPRYGYDRCEDDTVKNIEKSPFRVTAALRSPRRSPFKLMEYTITPTD